MDQLLKVSAIELPSKHLFFQIQQWKRQNNVWNLFQVATRLERWQWLRSGFFIVNFEQTSLTHKWSWFLSITMR